MVLFHVPTAGGDGELAAVAFSVRETTEDYCWIFQQASDFWGRTPDVLFSDMAQAIANARTFVWSRTKHFWCWVHVDDGISLRAPSYLRSEQQLTAFLELFKVAKYEPNVEHFWMLWQQLRDEHPAIFQSYLEPYYGGYKCLRWAFCFRAETFCAGKMSNNIAEGNNHSLKAHSKKLRASFFDAVVHCLEHAKSKSASRLVNSISSPLMNVPSNVYEAFMHTSARMFSLR